MADNIESSNTNNEVDQETTEKSYTKDELLDKIANFINSIDKETSTVKAENITDLQEVANGIKQAFNRVNDLSEKVLDQNKTNQKLVDQIQELHSQIATTIRTERDTSENEAEKLIERMKEE